MLYPGSLAGRTFMSVSLDCRVAACAGLAVVGLLFSATSASCVVVVVVVEAVTLFLRGTGAATLGSRGLRPRLGLVSVLVAEAPSATTGIFGLRPGFFRAGGAEGSAAVRGN